MGGKAKPTKHTASETARKDHLANTNMGGGAAGVRDRQGGAAGHSRFICKVCMSQTPDLKTMKTHYEAKHPTVEFKESDFENLHEKFGGTTKGVAIHGSLKKDKNFKNKE
ncbi:transcription factor [Strigomonas culicis]|uniref:Transcription factor n=1 Tax=Strigomonas culicis TaxID=28005 RepID=S9VXZ2_9TRYP|nr:transcription factor [Strigomonas culicis]|eukprot:EPY31931.1 transcription factor [Strigomonas culicis]